MQTFLPYADFFESAECLDRQRLGKQRVEVVQILRTLRGLTNGWSNHPAVKMWQGYIPALAAYGITICEEWESRGYEDRQAEIIRTLAGQGRSVMNRILYRMQYMDWPVKDLKMLPWWLSVPEFHQSHRRALLYKDPEWYGRMFPDEVPEMNYWWPTKHEQERKVMVRADT